MICTMGIISWSLMLPASVICQKPNRKKLKKKKKLFIDFLALLRILFFFFFFFNERLVKDSADKSYANLHNLYQYNNAN